MRIGREAWILGAMLAVFVTASVYYSQQEFERQRRSQPTTFSAGPGGLGALFRLYERERIASSRGIRPLTEIPPRAGLVVMTFPLQREVAPEELSAIQTWVSSGGALLLIANDPYSLQPLDELYRDRVEVKAAQEDSGTVELLKSGSPFLRDVTSLSADGFVRFHKKPKAVVTELARDSNGAIAVTWQEGDGVVILLSDALAPENRRLALADNALLYLNIAQERASGDTPLVVFDEYHQGYGSEVAGITVMQAAGPQARALFWFGLFAIAIAIYNANQRFGSARRIESPAYRPSTEYITSMAGLYRRAAAGGIAVETLYRAFAHDLAGSVDAPPGASAVQVAELASRRFGWPAAPLRTMLSQCEAIVAGANPSDSEVLVLAREMESYRRRADLVRHA